MDLSQTADAQAQADIPKDDKIDVPKEDPKPIDQKSLVVGSRIIRKDEFKSAKDESELEIIGFDSGLPVVIIGDEKSAVSIDSILKVIDSDQSIQDIKDQLDILKSDKNIELLTQQIDDLTKQLDIANTKIKQTLDSIPQLKDTINILTKTIEVLES